MLRNPHGTRESVSHGDLCVFNLPPPAACGEWGRILTRGKRATFQALLTASAVEGVYPLFFLRLRDSVRMVATPTTEVRHRADHRPRFDSSAVRGLVVEELNVMV